MRETIPTPKRRRVPSWVLPLALLAASIYFFWIFPAQQGPRPVSVEFKDSKGD